MNTSSKQAPNWEFTKRKRWADLLVTELADTITIVLAPTCSIQYCSPSVTELLGWRDVDLLEKNFVEMIIGMDDQQSFLKAFQSCMRSRKDMVVYGQLRSHHNPTLFEIQGRPFFIPEEEDCQVVIISITPHPGKNLALLNTFQDLKIENVKLTQQRDALKAAVHAAQATAPSSKRPQGQYAAGSSGINSSGPGMSSMSYYMPTKNPYGQHLSPMFGTDSSSLSGAGFATNQHMYPNSTVPLPSADDNDTSSTSEGNKKKKAKKNPAEPVEKLCYACATTKSPEWRKGPKGPKTLCNACGLQWAKSQRKPKDQAGESSQAD